MSTILFFIYDIFYAMSSIFASMSGIFSAMSDIFSAMSGILIIIFTYPSSVAIHETMHDQVGLQMATFKGVHPDLFFAFSTRTSNLLAIIFMHVGHRGFQKSCHVH